MLSLGRKGIEKGGLSLAFAGCDESETALVTHVGETK